MSQLPALLRSPLYWLQAGCTLFAVYAAPLQAQLVGTLFTSPEQRAYMDFLRQDFLARSQDSGFDIAAPQIPDVPVTEEAEATGPVEFTLGGIMTSRDGSRSVWLNNRLLQESDLPDWIRIVAANPGLELELRANGSRWRLKPGQTVDITSGAIVEGYQRPAPPVEQAPVNPVAAVVEALPSASGDESTAGAEPVAATVTIVAEGTTAIPAGGQDAPLLEAEAISIEELSDEELDGLIRALQEARQANSNAPR